MFRIVAELQRIVDELEDEVLRLLRGADSAAARVFQAYAVHDVLGPVVAHRAGLVLDAVTHVADRLLDRVVAVNGLQLDDAPRDYLVTVVAAWFTASSWSGCAGDSPKRPRRSRRSRTPCSRRASNASSWPARLSSDPTPRTCRRGVRSGGIPEKCASAVAPVCRTVRARV